jgi:hypothetical protein
MGADGKLSVFEGMQSAKELWKAEQVLGFVRKVMKRNWSRPSTMATLLGFSSMHTTTITW